MKKTLLLLSSLFVLANTSPVYAQDNDLEKLQQEVQTKAEELNQAINDLRAAYNNNNAMQVGDPIVYESGLIVTVDNVELAQPREYDDVQHTLIRVDVTIDNQTAESIRVSANDFDLYDGDRVATEHITREYFAEDVASGMKAEGAIYYDIKNKGTITFILGAGTWTFDIE